MSTCPYCGKNVRDSDRFCLYCGEPLLKKEEPEETEVVEVKEDKKKKGKKKPEFEGSSTMPAELDAIEDELMGEDDDEIPFLPEGATAELDPEIKNMIQAHIDMYHLAKKIKKVQTRIASSLEMMEDPDFKKKYDLDDEFRKKNSIRFEALKQLGKELKEKKDKLEKVTGKDNKLKMDNLRIRQLKKQIVELNNSFKMRKIDRKAYDTLHSEYKINLKNLLKQREITNIQLSAWISTVKSEQDDLRIKISVAKGRKQAKEINKKEFKEEKEELERDIKKLNEDIKVIESFIYKD